MPPPQPSLSTATRAIFKETAPDPAPATQGKKRVWSVKASLKDVRRDYARKRTQEASTFLSDFCSRQKENQLDLLYFLLTENLHGSGDSRYNEVLFSPFLNMLLIFHCNRVNYFWLPKSANLVNKKPWILVSDTVNSLSLIEKRLF